MKKKGIVSKYMCLIQIKKSILLSRFWSSSFIYKNKNPFNILLTKWKEKHATFVCRSNVYTIITNSCVILNINSIFFCVSRCYKGSEDCRKIHRTMNIFLQWSVYMYLHVIDWIRETLKKIFNKGCIFFTLIPSLNYSNSYTLIVS